MTTDLRDVSVFSAFSRWFNHRGQTGELESRRYRISFNDIDGYIFSDRPPRFYALHVEVKSHGNTHVPAHQRTALYAQHAVNSLANGKRISFRPWNRPQEEDREYLYFGTHLLVLSGNCPATSHNILWDHKYYLTEQELCEVLRFDRDPRIPHKSLLVSSVSPLAYKPVIASA